MTVTTRTRNSGRGKLHFIHFTFNSDEAIVELLPAKTNVRYSLQGGIVNQPAGSLWFFGADKILTLVNVQTNEIIQTGTHGLTESGTLIGRGTSCTPALSSYGAISFNVSTASALEMTGTNVTSAGGGGQVAINPEPIIGDVVGNVGLTALGVAGFTHYDVPSGIGETGKNLSVAAGTVGAFISGSIWVGEEVLAS